MNQTMERQFEVAVQTGVLPGVALMAKDRTGLFEYERYFGFDSVKNDAWPIHSTTLFQIGGATKLIVSICAMQCVDSGLVHLDDDVRRFIPELEEVTLLIGFNEHDRPILTEPKNKITLRNLLSHSSGFAYPRLSPLITKWQRQPDHVTGFVGSHPVNRFLYPLDAEPGTRWMYSPSIDWVGRLVECLTKMNLYQYIQFNICHNLNLQRLTFFPQQGPYQLDRHAEISLRDPHTGVLKHVNQSDRMRNLEGALGGSGVFTTASDFFKILNSLLVDDQRILSSRSRNELLSPQLTEQSRESLAETLKNEHWYEYLNFGGGFPVGSVVDHSLCGMYLRENADNYETAQQPGSVAWSGRFNFHWLIDPAAEICLLYASQVEPRDDIPSKKFLRLFVRHMYLRVWQIYVERDYNPRQVRG